MTQAATRHAQTPRPDYSQRFLERYGRTLTDDEIQLLQASRGLPDAQRIHLRRYAAGLIVEHVSEGRVLEASRELRRYYVGRGSR